MSDDPSQVATAQLYASARRDLAEGMRLTLDAYRFLQQARATIAELERRNAEEKSAF